MVITRKQTFDYDELNAEFTVKDSFVYLYDLDSEHIGSASKLLDEFMIQEKGDYVILAFKKSDEVTQSAQELVEMFYGSIYSQGSTIYECSDGNNATIYRIATEGVPLGTFKVKGDEVVGVVSKSNEDELLTFNTIYSRLCGALVSAEIYG